MRTLRILLTATILLLSVAGVSAQQVSSDAANQLFAAGKYREAIPVYSQLLERYSEDPTYNYRLGVCYFLSDEDLNAAYKYLKAASTKEVPNKVYYYLGEVCRYLYRFDESLNYYKRFMVNGGSTDVSTIALEQAASAASNGQNLLRYSAKVTPIAKALVNATDFYKTYDTYPSSSGFGEIPAELKTVLDGKKGLRSLIFSHVDGGNVGDISVYASYGQNETGSKDLFFIQKVDERTWSRPQRLPGTINSPFDEDYAYMCPDNRTLYFASKGLYSIGGYDIYRTTYNSEKNTWSTPENLGFPINSPYDDYLFVPDQEGKTACFASMRGVKDNGMIAVFKVDGVDNPIRVELSSEAAYALQGLDKAADKTEAEADGSAVTHPNNATTEVTEGVALIPEYRKIKLALANNEALSDSTSKKIERLRGVWADMPDSTRKDVEKLIVFNEQKLLELESIHNQLLNQASALERDYLSGKLKVEVVETPTVNEWFVQNSKLADYFTNPQLEKLTGSPLRMGLAMALVDSVSSISVQIQDLRQILAAADSLEKVKVRSKIGDFERSLIPTIKRLSTSWPLFYATYFEVLSQVAQAVPSLSHEDTLLIGGAQRSFLSAKGIRNGVVASGDLLRDYQKVEEAYLSEQKSLNQLSLYLARVANEKSIVDSLSTVLNPSKEGGQPDVVVAETSDFGVVKRDNVEIPPIVFSAPTNSGEFAVNTAASYSRQNPMPTVKSLPMGVVYSFQLGMFSQYLNYTLFRFSPMFYETVGGSKRVFAGIFNSYASAQSRIAQVKENGFKDAFIVAFADKKLVPLAKAKALETKKGSDGKQPTALPAAMFRVVVGTFVGEMPRNIKEIVEKLLSDKEIIKSPMADGLITYSIGNFDTFEQAISFKNKLISEGIVEAFVTKIDLNPNGQQ